MRKNYQLLDSLVRSSSFKEVFYILFFFFFFMIICGVEEAGRGPVIGPLVMAAVCIDKKDEEKLANVGVKDSKLLTPRKREQLFDIVKEIAKSYKIVKVSASEVDDVLMGEDLNLNSLEAMKSAELIDALKQDQAILDCPSNNIHAYVKFVKVFLKDDKVKILAEHKDILNN